MKDDEAQQLVQMVAMGMNSKDEHLGVKVSPLMPLLNHPPQHILINLLKHNLTSSNLSDEGFFGNFFLDEFPGLKCFLNTHLYFPSITDTLSSFRSK